MIIQVKIGTNTNRKTVNLDNSTTLRNALESNGVELDSQGVISLDGCPLQPGDINKTFADFGVDERCSLTKVVKADNA